MEEGGGREWERGRREGEGGGRREEKREWRREGRREGGGREGGREWERGREREERGGGGKRGGGGRREGRREGEGGGRFLCPRGNCLRADWQEWTLSEFQTEVRELVSNPKKPRRQRQRERERVRFMENKPRLPLLTVWSECESSACQKSPARSVVLQPLPLRCE